MFQASSIADSSVGNTPSGTSAPATSPGSSLYPSLAETMADVDEDDILATLGVPPAKPKSSSKPSRPARPPPPRSSPTSLRSSSPGQHRMKEEVYVPPPLHPHEIRWFYHEPGKFWQPFGGHDSLCLETCYLDGLSRSSGGKGVVAPEEVSVMGDLYDVHVEKRTMVPIYWPCKEPWKVLRGCWFEVVGDKWYPFMEADYTIIEEEHTKKKWRETAKELQDWTTSVRTYQLQQSQPNTVPKAQTTPAVGANQDAEDVLQVVNKLALDKYDILWLANGDIFKMKKEVTSQLWNKVGQKFGKGALFGGSKVMRGYKEYASGEERLPPIGHVVFVTHGIGQTMDASDITTSTKEFREATAKVAKSNFAELWSDKRVEFIPVEWRTGLSLDNGLVNRITPRSLKMLRGLVNDCVMDVFYYFSPKFGPEILNGLKTALQKQYDEFIGRHPHFLSSGGTVSVIAHSLGSVMMYDLLREKCELDPEIRSIVGSTSSRVGSMAGPGSFVGGGIGRGREVDFTLGSTSSESDGDPFGSSSTQSSEEAIRMELEQLKKRVAYLEHQLVLKKAPEPLSFSIDHFFAFGSPTALFIAMKEYETLVTKDHRSAESFLPSCVCKRIHNLHHPSDPIAYRLEPLVHSCYSQVKPVKISAASGKISQDMVDHAEGPRTEADLQQRTNKSWWKNVGQSLINYAGKKLEGTVNSSSVEQSQPPEKIVDSDKDLDPNDKLRERLDFTLKEGVIENSYFNSITAHHIYWNSPDCAQYVLLQLYKYKRPQS